MATSVYIVLSVAYCAAAIATFALVRRLKRRISRGKFYSRRPELFKKEFGGVFMDLIVAATWPLQLVGLLFSFWR